MGWRVGAVGFHPPTDTFDRSNQAPMGTTSDGSATWTDLVGTWQVSSNIATAASIAIGPRAIATIPAIADGTVQVNMDQSTGGQKCGIVFRVQDDSNYWSLRVDGLYKTSAGVTTQVAALSLTGSGTIAVEMNGSSITAKWNGVTVASTTDSFLSTATGAGLGLFSNAPTHWNNFNVTAL